MRTQGRFISSAERSGLVKEPVGSLRKASGLASYKPPEGWEWADGGIVEHRLAASRFTKPNVPGWIVKVV